jgi:cytochrome c5
VKNATCYLTISFFASAFLNFLFIPSNAYSQKKTQEQTLAAFPENISGIFSTSCVYCHSDQSTSKAKMFMNLSDWDKMKPKKQVKKGKLISKKASKGAMPPSGFLEKHPDAALNEAQKASIRAWVNAMPKN